MTKPLRLATRGSHLAIWQARAVAALLEARGDRVEIITITTTGDRQQDAPLSAIGGKGVFVKEIEDALLRGDADLAVHSAKDMSAVLPDGLEVGGVLPREDPRDALVMSTSRAASGLDEVLHRLGSVPRIGTGSARRSAQVAVMIPGAEFGSIRGNLETRLRKLDEDSFTALVLAAAGLRRLGLTNRISAAIPIDRCIPAPGQGTVAIEIRSDDQRIREAVAPLSHAETAVSLVAERAVVAALGGGCQLPLGAIAVHDGGQLQMHAVVASPDGRQMVQRHASGPARDPAGLGRRVADELALGGAREILDDARRLG